LRNCYRTGDKEKTNALKDQIIQKHGDKGRNIANLCTAKYLEDFLIPLHSSLMQEYKDDRLANEAFIEKYKPIVMELPFTIFVGFPMSVEEIRKQIATKKQYGIKFVNIHGIGENNIKKIKDVILGKEKDGQFIINELKEEKNSLFVRINFVPTKEEVV
jgi:hypothetical protein